MIVDSALRPGGVAEDWQERVLDDGSRHSVYKRWFTAEGLAEELGGGEVLHDGPWFVAVRSSSPALLNEAPWLRSPSAKWGGSGVPPCQAACDALGHRGAVLEAVARSRRRRARPIGCSGCGATMKCESAESS